MEKLGITYEFIKLCTFHMKSQWIKNYILPSRILQKFTTREPPLQELEIALKVF